MEAFAKDIKLVTIGNSKGIRLPNKLLQKYGFRESILVEETPEGILLKARENPKLSWEKTYQEIAHEHENWDDFDATLLDGLK